MRTFFVIVLLLTGVVSDVEGQTARTLEQTDVPVSIEHYTAEYRESGTYSRAGVNHSLGYKNVSNKPIRAIQFGLVSFSVFNEFLDRTGGIDMEPLGVGKESNGSWVATALADFSFFTGVAYVWKVRFEDDTIWEADTEEILRQLRTIEADFDAARLQRAAGGDGDEMVLTR